jgi:hypothetical protein
METYLIGVWDSSDFMIPAIGGSRNRYGALDICYQKKSGRHEHEGYLEMTAHLSLSPFGGEGTRPMGS